MVTEYATDLSNWKPWQREYAYGVLLVFPPDPPLEEVNRLRKRYAWSQSSECNAHISLTMPVPRQLFDADLIEIRSIAATIEPFSVHYGPMSNYLPHPGVVLDIQPQSKLDGLRKALETASAFGEMPPRKYPFRAHMTIAEMITVEQTHSIMEELKGITPEGDFICTDIVYAVPDNEFRFTERRRIQLGAE